jgi:hypothetical protein
LKAKRGIRGGTNIVAVPDTNDNVYKSESLTRRFGDVDYKSPSSNEKEEMKMLGAQRKGVENYRGVIKK